MLKLSVTIFILLLIPLIAEANLKDCVTSLALVKSGTLTLTQGEDTDLRGLPSMALAQIVKSLRGYWIQIGTREAGFPSFGNISHKKKFLTKVLDIGERVQFGRSMLVVIGALGETHSPNVPDTYVTTEISLNDITSVQLVDVPEITVSVSTSNKTPGMVVSRRN